MAINPNLFIHESDKAALKALKAVPGFSQVLKAFMSIYNENVTRIMNMSTMVRISEQQIPKYHAMLKDVCAKLQIEEPELYLALDDEANAYTTGENHPVIVMTSGLMEILPEELIPTVLAHECGHILCHHQLYMTMGSMILNGAITALGIPNALILPLQLAFSYWMRCAEFSADRAAVLYHGGYEEMAELCARFAGFTKEVNADINMEAFMNQAGEYKKMTADSKWNRTLELLMISGNSHPLHAVRAYECREWTGTEQFAKVSAYLKNGAVDEQVPLLHDARYYLGKGFEEVLESFEQMGFTRIVRDRTSERPGLLARDGQVLCVQVGGNEKFEENEWVSLNSEILIRYYQPLSGAEIRSMHPGEVMLEQANTQLIGKNAAQVAESLKWKGMLNVTMVPEKDIEDPNSPNLGRILSVCVNGKYMFAAGEWVPCDAPVVIVYRALKGE